MRYSLHDIEFDKFIVHRYPGFVAVVQEYVKFNYFLYDLPHPDFFKITLNWQVSINHYPGLSIPLADIDAEQEIVLEVNKVFGADKTKLEHLITSSYTDLQQAFQEKTKGSAWHRHRFLPFDYEKAVHNLFYDIQSNSGIPRNFGARRNDRTEKMNTLKGSITAVDEKFFLFIFKNLSERTGNILHLFGC